ncbi:MAG: 16S rRNA processing protein RimM [Aquificota bacterium]|nr:MAG: 16S rRNA processing protein RimM [Aquificota bacterium]
MNEENQYVVIGKVLDTYGLKGELKVQTYLERRHWSKIKRVFLKRKGGEYVPFSVEYTKPHGKDQLILKFEGFNAIEQVEAFRGAKIFLPEEELPKKKRGEYYYFELEGLEVLTESGKQVGRVSGIIEQKPYDLLEVDGGRLYIPFVEALVKDVRLKEGKVIVKDILAEL